MNKEILEGFFNDEASEAEVEEVLAWFKEQQLDPQKIQSLEELWHQIDESDFVSHDSDQILRHIHQQIKEPDAKNTGKKYSSYSKIPRQSHSALPIWTKAAAVLIVAGIFSFWGANSWLSSDVEREEQQVTKIAKPGEKKTLKLSDGTVIQLNAGTSITFPDKFAKRRREVVLTGEAFFDVKDDPTRPFIVRTERLSATVLGTSFNVKSYGDDQQADVSLATGRLKVEHRDTVSGSTSYVLAPGEAAVLDKRDNTLKKTDFDPKLRLGWIQGALVFQDADLDELITRIERWYGVTIEVENREEAVNIQWKYRGVFKNEPLGDVLKGISYVKDFTYEIENKKVKIIF